MFTREKRKCTSRRGWYMNVHSSAAHSNPKPGTPQISAGKATRLGISIFQNKEKGQITNNTVTGWLSEYGAKRRRNKSVCCSVPFLWDSGNDENKLIGGFLGLRWGRGGVTAQGSRELSGAAEMFCIPIVAVVTQICICRNSSNGALKTGTFHCMEITPLRRWFFF